MEDASWLRKDHSCHINMTEKDATIKTLNLPFAWGTQSVELLAYDSATVHRWIFYGLSGRSKLMAKAASEMLIGEELVL